MNAQAQRSKLTCHMEVQRLPVRPEPGIPIKRWWGTSQAGSSMRSRRILNAIQRSWGFTQPTKRNSLWVLSREII